MSTTARATAAYRTTIPAPLEVFGPMPSHADTLVPQLAIDRLVYDIQQDVQTFALDYLILRQTVKSLEYRRDQEVRARTRTDLTDAIEKRIDALRVVVERIEDRLDGRVGQGGKSIEEVRESLSDLLAREVL